MAEHLLRRELRRRGVEEEIHIRSAGIAPYARDGALISLDTRMALRDVGIPLSEEETSTDLKRHPELLAAADMVIAMTKPQIHELRERFTFDPLMAVYTLREVAGENGDIADPFEQGHEAFAACREEISRLIPLVVDRLLKRAQSPAFDASDS
jgi:protein-tyrosine-phosphatase